MEGRRVELGNKVRVLANPSFNIAADRNHETSVGTRSLMPPTS
jgi:hypothetical protein